MAKTSPSAAVGHQRACLRRGARTPPSTLPNSGILREQRRHHEVVRALRRETHDHKGACHGDGVQSRSWRVLRGLFHHHGPRVCGPPLCGHSGGAPARDARHGGDDGGRRVFQQRGAILAKGG